MSDEQPEQTEIDVRNNRESKAGSADSTQRVARASDGGAPPRDAPRAGELPEQTTGGTAAGNPVAGVTIGDADRKDAVSGDTGPIGDEAPAVGHA